MGKKYKNWESTWCKTSKNTRFFEKEIWDSIDIDSAINPYRRNIKEFRKLLEWADNNWFDWIIWKSSDDWMNFIWNEFIPTKNNKYFEESESSIVSD